MCDSWWSNKGVEIQSFADRSDMKRFYSALKDVYGPPSNSLVPLMNKDGTVLLTDKTQILHCWAEHFEDLNRESSIDDEALQNIQHLPLKEELAAIPTTSETTDAIKSQSNGKAAGSDAIPAKIY